ncbi:MAG: glycosyltransferase family 9 protein, partial [Verrucomicrobiota bacterium]
MFARLLAILTPSFARGFCRVAGWLVAFALPGRRRITLNSLAHAYPEKSDAARRRIFRESTARLIEMGLFRLVSAYFSDRRLRECLEISPEAEAIIGRHRAGGARAGRPVVILLPHMTMAEAATHLPARVSGLPPVHVIFRPLNQPSLSRWVTRERERFGARMISRRSGHNEAMAALRRGEMVAILFDQDASKKGSTITFMDRVVSATDLPGLMAHRFQADVYLMLLERTAFWRAKLTLREVPRGESPVEVTIRAHDLLEDYLRRDDDAAADWLWLHNRWDHYYSPRKRFRLPEKRNRIEVSNRMHGRSELPRKVRFWVRMPNWLGDVVMALPVLRAIREGRPDFEITLIGKEGFRPLFERLEVADRFIALPEKGGGYFRRFYERRLEYPDTYLLFTNSLRGDLEAFATRCPQRFGMVRPGRKRPLLTDPFLLSAEIDEASIHQTMLWEQMARFYGLRVPLDFSPLAKKTEAAPGLRIGLICGTENAPEKRWPVASWRELVDKLLDGPDGVELILYGTSADRAITEQVAEGFAAESVRNLAGQTDLAAFCDGLSGCRAVVCNDTGGMHLANMLVTPVVGIFGPTNPVRTGPVFETP